MTPGGIAQGVMEDCTLTNSMGKITTRAEDIGKAKKNDPQYEIFENYDMKVCVHGDTAVVTGKTHTKGISGGKPFGFQFQFTDTFVKDGGCAGVCSPAMSQSCLRNKVRRDKRNPVWPRPRPGLARRRASAIIRVPRYPHVSPGKQQAAL